MNELMRYEILDQPEALRKTLPGVRQQLPHVIPHTAGLARVFFTGSGDSYFAPLALEYAARLSLPMDVHVFPSQIAARYCPYDARDMLVAISISGEAGRTVEAARKARASGAYVLGVTTNEASTLAKESTAALIIPFRSRSRQTPHTTDWLTGLLTVAAIFERLADLQFPVLDDLSDVVSGSLQTLEKPCFDIADTLKHKERFYFLGTGPSFGVAFYAASKFWEVGGVKVFYSELEEFGHGPHMLVAPDDPVFVIAPRGRSVDRARLTTDSLSIVGARVFVITDDPQSFGDVQVIHSPVLDEEWSPFGTSLSVQWLCLAIANAKGYDVVVKNSLAADPKLYEKAHRQLVRDV